jgi:membrane associated rhomboid family serine protease
MKEEHGNLTEKKNVINSMLYPVILVAVIWFVKGLQMLFDLSLHQYGIFPMTISGLKGIIFSPFIHGSFSHLFSNSIPLLVLGTALFYFYKAVAFRVIIFSWLITGLWVWVFARSSFHIGASGLIYSLAAFLFVSGILRRHPRLMALSLLVVFLYGGMVWGVFPTQERISWESHLMGMVCGLFLAFFFRRHGPQRKLYTWEVEELMQSPDEEDNDDPYVVDDPFAGGPDYWEEEP